MERPDNFFDIHPTQEDIEAHLGPCPPSWYACEHPERPFDMDAVYARACPPCQLAFQVAQSKHPDLWIFNITDGVVETLALKDIT